MKYFLFLILFLPVLMLAQGVSNPGIGVVTTNTTLSGNGTGASPLALSGFGLGALTSGTSYHAFGDSITEGSQGTTSTAYSYPSLVAAGKNWTLTNHGVSGAMVAEQTSAVYATTTGTNFSTYSIALGANDERIFSTDATKRGAFRAGYQSLIAYLAIPASLKITGTDTSKVTYSGTWTTEALWSGAGNIGKYSNNSGATTATFKVSGTVIYMGMLYAHPNASTYTISVDGVAMGGTYNMSPGVSITSDLSSLAWLPRLIRLTNLSEGEHTVVITTSNNSVYFEWAAGNGRVNRVGGPQVYVSTVTRMTTAGYVTYGGSDANVAAYNAEIRTLVQELASDGLNVALVDVSPNVNNTTDISGDGIHPDDAGHANIAAAYLWAMNGLSLARDRQAYAGRLPSQNLQVALSATNAVQVLSSATATAAFMVDTTTNTATAPTLSSSLVTTSTLAIGTASPLRAFHASSSTSDALRLRLTQTATNAAGYTGFEFYGAGGVAGTYAGGVFREQNTNNISIWSSNSGSGAERMTVQDSSGNVEVGGTTFAHRFSVTGGDSYIQVKNTAAGNAGLALWPGTGAADRLDFLDSTGTVKSVIAVTSAGFLFYVNGVVNVWNIPSTGHLLAAADNTYGIGGTSLGATGSRPAFVNVGTTGLSVAGSFALVVTSTNGSITFGAAHANTIYTGTGGHTHTLPTSVGISGRTYEDKNEGTGALTLNTTSSQTIFNTTAATSWTLNIGDAQIAKSDGANWSGIPVRPIIRLSGTLVSGTSSVTDTRISGRSGWVQDTNTSSLTNVGTLTMSISGSTATIKSTNIVDTSTFDAFFVTAP